MTLNDGAHLSELREDQGALASLARLFKHLNQPRQFARAAYYRGVVLEELRRMIADLFELGEHGENYALALNSVGGFDCGHRLLDHRGIERCLLRGQGAIDLHFALV